MVASRKRKRIKISLIVPAYNQAKTIVRDIHRIQKVLSHLPPHYLYEIIVVVDGKTDSTYARVRPMASSRLKIEGYSHNHGKGYAVRFGMAKATGDVIAFLDAGMDLDPNGLLTLLTTMEERKADIVIGSKLHPKSEVVYPWQRTVLSWGYRSLVRACFGLSIRDTQVGMKLFRRSVLRDVFPRLLVKSYAFDIEILAVAHHLGYTKIYEAPIRLTFNHWSSIKSYNFWKTIWKMLWDTSAVYYRLHIVKYYDNHSKRKWKYDPELKFRINIG